MVQNICRNVSRRRRRAGDGSRRHAGDDRTSIPLQSLLDTVFLLENCEDLMKITLKNRRMRLMKQQELFC
jgi:hypothetical protein